MERDGGAGLLRRAAAALAGFFLLAACQSTDTAVEDASVRQPSAYGSYLAGLYAWGQRDAQPAAGYFTDALALEPDNSDILTRAFLVSAEAGNTERAVAYAKRLEEDGRDDYLVAFALALDAFKNDDYTAAKAYLAKDDMAGLLRYVGTLATAWADVGAGDPDAAIATLEELKGSRGFRLFQIFHTALIQDYLGNPTVAGKAYAMAMEESGGLSLRIVQAYASHLSRTGQAPKAIEALAAYAEASPDNPIMTAELGRVRAGEALPPLVSSPQEGVAEALYGIARALAQQSGFEISDLYLRFALFLRSDFDVAQILLAGNLENENKWREAILAYKDVPRDSPLHLDAEMQAAAALDRLGETDRALAELGKLVEAHPDNVDGLILLADVYRRNEGFEKAAQIYSTAIDRIGKPTANDWTLYYARGICYERLGEWPLAETDLQLALNLSENHPLVLNYLGYSWIEQGRHLERSLGMIEQAVEMRPDDGYIVDSLGWAHYRLGNYSQAADYLEQAVELEPGDPLINEHLGDALWMAGRTREARFQWSHALEFNPDPARVPEIEAKLIYGVPPETLADTELAAPAAPVAPATEGF